MNRLRSSVSSIPVARRFSGSTGVLWIKASSVSWLMAPEATRCSPNRPPCLACSARASFVCSMVMSFARTRRWPSSIRSAMGTSNRVVGSRSVDLHYSSTDNSALLHLQPAMRSYTFWSCPPGLAMVVPSRRLRLATATGDASAVLGLFRSEPECGGQQLCHRRGDSLAVRGGIEHRRLRIGKLQDGLAAGSARHRGRAVQVYDGDGATANGPPVHRTRRGNRRLLGAAGQPVRGVLHVGAGDDRAFLTIVRVQQNRRPHAEAAVRRVGVLRSLGGALVQRGDFGGRWSTGWHKALRLAAGVHDGKPPAPGACIQTARAQALRLLYAAVIAPSAMPPTSSRPKRTDNRKPAAASQPTLIAAPSQLAGDEESATALALFHPITAAWFRATFPGPTAPQRQGWPAIARGDL